MQEVGPYIYIFLIGTRPECQNMGLGSILMRHINAYADSRELPCYLEVGITQRSCEEASCSGCVHA